MIGAALETITRIKCVYKYIYIYYVRIYATQQHSRIQLGYRVKLYKVFMCLYRYIYAIVLNRGASRVFMPRAVCYTHEIRGHPSEALLPGVMILFTL